MTEEIAQSWLAKAGKRWRPFLAACVYQAVQDDPNGPLPDDLRAGAIAVECFHKASLIHDDIEDDDALRYGEKTLHEQYGVPVALNVGDFLLGEGYRLLASTGATPDRRAAMLQAVAEGHRSLCLGQGAELCWMRTPEPLAPASVLDIFRRKTAPAFEVALRVGAILAGCGEDLREVIHKYSAAVGIAYQIRDDLEDFGDCSEASDLRAARPSLLLALAYERAQGSGRKLLERVWRKPGGSSGVSSRLEEVVRDLAVEARAQELLDFYKNEAIRSLCGLDNTQLKGLLRRVVGRIFNEVEFMGCCNDYQAGDAAGGEGGSEAA
jgi:geranylgeranyl pyrophosphate synthase